MLSNPLSRSRELIAGASGVILIVALFLPWADDANAWDLMPGPAAICAIAGITALVCALTRGRIGVFRPDVSVGGAADLFSVVAAIMIAWFLIDLPDGASTEAGIFVALAAACAIFMAVGDYASFRGAPAFPRLDKTER